MKHSLLGRLKRNIRAMGFREGLFLLSHGIFLLLSVGGGIVLYRTGFELHQRHRNWEKLAISTKAQVVAKEANPKPKKSKLGITAFRPPWTISVKYRVSNGKEIGPLKVQCSDPLGSEIQVGDEIEIRRDKIVSTRFVIVGDQSVVLATQGLRRWGIGFFALAFFGLFWIALYLVRSDDRSLFLKGLRAVANLFVRARD